MNTGLEDAAGQPPGAPAEGVPPIEHRRRDPNGAVEQRTTGARGHERECVRRVAHAAGVRRDDRGGVCGRSARRSTVTSPFRTASACWRRPAPSTTSGPPPAARASRTGAPPSWTATSTRGSRRRPWRPPGCRVRPCGPRSTRTIALVEAAQGDDGYLNSYDQVAEPGLRWTDFAQGHELYGAGHLFQAAVARRCADYLHATFGPGRAPGDARASGDREGARRALPRDPGAPVSRPRRVLRRSAL